MLPVLALLAVAAVRFIGRRPVNWLGAFVAACVGLLSHLMLDWTNIYGIRMLLPFSGEWLRLDTTSVVDLWIWSVCLLAISVPFFILLMGHNIPSARPTPRHPARS